MIDRRRLVILLAAVSGASAAGGRAAEPTMRRIGFLSFGSPPKDGSHPWSPRPLAERGWVEGRNIEVVSYYAGDNAELLGRHAAALVARKVDVIATSGTDAALAAQAATKRIPILLLAAGDPVGSGLVASLARPGGNITGFSVLSTELRAKRVELLRELLPQARRAGEFVNPRNPLWKVRRQDYEHSYRALGMDAAFIDVATAEAVPDAFAQLVRQRIEVLMVNDDNLFGGALAAQMMRMALERRIPTIVGDTALVDDGGLIGYGLAGGEGSEKFAYFLDRILRGTAPADLPIQQATRFRLAINLRTAKALELTIPVSMLARADRVIR
jgi:putative ABC transport system substrate-binding protein